MGGCFLYGNGKTDLLNFEVVGGTSAPANPKENTIWVNMSTKIADWHFSATRPTNPVNGTVWICVGASSGVNFNALKNNELMVYPIRVERFIQGINDSGEYSSWDTKELKIYQNGEWKDGFAYLYLNGDTCDHITGGYQSLTVGNGSKSCDMNESSIYVSATGDPQYTAMAGACTNNKIDLTNIKTIYVEGNCSSYQHSGWIGIRVHQNMELGDNKYSAQAWITQTGDFVTSIDVSGLSGYYYVIVCALGYSGGYAKGTITKIWYQ